MGKYPTPRRDLKGEVDDPEEPRHVQVAVSIAREVIVVLLLTAASIGAWLSYVEVTALRRESAALWGETKALREDRGHQLAIDKLARTEHALECLTSQTQLAESARFLEELEPGELAYYRFIEGNPVVRGTILDTLNCFERIALLYNMDSLNEKFLLVSWGTEIVWYWKAAEELVESLRRQSGDPQLYEEYRQMVGRICEREAEPEIGNWCRGVFSPR